VFCATREAVRHLYIALRERGFAAVGLSGEMGQSERTEALQSLRDRRARVCVATDVAARGLDIDLLTHVVNYEVPSAPEAYVHRIGRVGRAGREGVAITLAEPRERRLLDNIERVTRQPIAVERIPTVSDLRARQLELTTEAVREHVGADDLERFRTVVDALVADHDLETVALAAVRLVHELSGATLDEVEIPDVTAARPRPERSAERRGAPGSAGVDKRRLADTQPTARIYVGAGRSSRVRPNDLVGAIANETRLSGRDIGAIWVADHYSVVEIPESAVDEVIAAMSRTTVKGKRVTVRRYRDEPR
jgi:ATP-dependent RNA helicase DeaD